MLDGLYGRRSPLFLRLIFFLLLCQATCLIGSLFTAPSIPTWYTALIKPPFTPPNWVFPVVWETLFVMMAVAAFIVHNAGRHDNEGKAALTLFFIQLVLNISWSALFFGLQSPFLAFMEIMILWIAIALTMILFFNISVIAGLLLFPYILWVTFAMILNFRIFQLNR